MNSGHWVYYTIRVDREDSSASPDAATAAVHVKVGHKVPALAGRTGTEPGSLEELVALATEGRLGTGLLANTSWHHLASGGARA